MSTNQSNFNYNSIIYEFFLMFVVASLLNIFRVRELPPYFEVGMINGVYEEP